jgi:hypothetical protein
MFNRIPKVEEHATMHPEIWQKNVQPHDKGSIKLLLATH